MPKIQPGNVTYGRFFLQRTWVLREARDLQNASISDQYFNKKLQDYIGIYSQNPQIAQDFLSFLADADLPGSTRSNRLQDELRKEIKLMSKNCGEYSNNYFNTSLNCLAAAGIIFICRHLLSNAEKSPPAGVIVSMSAIIYFTISILAILSALKIKSNENDWDYIDTPTTAAEMV